MKKGNDVNRKLKYFLVISISVSIALAAVNLYQFEMHTTDSKLPKNYLQPINTSYLNGQLPADLATGMPITLKHTGHLTGQVASDTPVYFYITYDFNGTSLPLLSVGSIKNASTVVNGPARWMNVSTELPAGQWWINIYSPSSTTIVNTYDFYLNYTPFPTAIIG